MMNLKCDTVSLYVVQEAVINLYKILRSEVV